MRRVLFSEILLPGLVIISACNLATRCQVTYKPTRKLPDDAGKHRKIDQPINKSSIPDRNQSITDQSIHHRSVSERPTSIQPIPDHDDHDHRKLDADRNQFQEAFNSSLVHIFRMKTAPKWNQSRVQISDYMMALYDQFSEEARNIARSRDATTGRRKRHFFPAANTIRSFNTEELTSELSGRSLHLRVHFNISTIPQHELISGTELRVNYRSVIDDVSQPRQNASQPKRRPRLRISVYMITDPVRLSDLGFGYQKLQPHRLLDSRVIRQSPCVSCWEVFHVTNAVNQWKQSGQTNRGLRVVISEVQKEGRTEKLTSGGKAANRRMAYRFPGAYDDQEPDPDVENPLLVVYLNDGTAPVPQAKPDLAPKTGRKRHRKRSAPTGSGNRKGRKKETRCRRWPLYVDFNEVGWNDWIVAPAGYHAYFCQGECPYYLPDNLNSTNHAVVQTLVHSVNPHAVPKPCCVPTELSSISMLYIDSSEKVIIKNYQDMVVEACGCR